MHYVLYCIITDNTSTGDNDMNVPVTDNSCYESVIKKDRLQCTVTPNPCYEVVSTEQHKTTDERTTNTNNTNNTNNTINFI